MISLKECEPGYCCAITTLCTVLGCPPKTVGRMLKQVVWDDRKEDIQVIRSDYAQGDWLKGFERMGVKLVTVLQAGRKNRENIKQTVSALNNGRLYVIYCELSDPREPTHVFATQSGKVVDTWTNGKVVDVNDLPNAFPAYEVETIYEAQ